MHVRHNAARRRNDVALGDQGVGLWEDSRIPRDCRRRPIAAAPDRRRLPRRGDRSVWTCEANPIVRPRQRRIGLQRRDRVNRIGLAAVQVEDHQRGLRARACSDLLRRSGKRQLDARLFGGGADFRAEKQIVDGARTKGAIISMPTLPTLPRLPKFCRGTPGNLTRIRSHAPASQTGNGSASGFGNVAMLAMLPMDRCHQGSSEAKSRARLPALRPVQRTSPERRPASSSNGRDQGCRPSRALRVARQDVAWRLASSRPAHRRRSEAQLRGAVGAARQVGREHGARGRCRAAWAGPD